MRCTACNKALSDKESTFKDSRGDYTDMCFECLQFVYESIDESEWSEEKPVDKDEEPW